MLLIIPSSKRRLSTVASEIPLVSLSRLLGTVASYMGYGGLNSIYVGIITGGVIALMLSRKYIPKNTSKQIRPKNLRIRDYILRKQTLITAIALLAVALLMNVDLMFVKRSFSPVEAGIYSSWSLLSRIIGYFTAPLLAVSLLFFSAKESEKDHKKVLYFLMSSIVVIGSFALFLYQTYTSEVLLLIFSSKFLGIAPLAPYAALFGMLVTIIALVTNYHISNNNYASLVTLTIIPIHIVLLVIFGISLENIIVVNVGSAFLTAGILIVSLLHTS
jgi:O-antigen/teichoic acid export membrane protein